MLALWDELMLEWGWYIVSFLLGCMVTHACWMVREHFIIKAALKQISADAEEDNFDEDD